MGDSIFKKVEGEPKKACGAKAFAALLLVVISYYYSVFQLYDFNSLFRFLSTGLPYFRDSFFSMNLFQVLPQTPAVFLWFFIGTFVYFFYYSLSLVYYQFGNWLIVKTSYVNTDQDENKIDLGKLRRGIIHLTIVVYYLTAVIVSYLFSIPLSEQFRNYLSLVFAKLIPVNFAFYLSFLFTFILWFLLLNVFTFFVGLLTDVLGLERIKDEHFASVR